MYYMQCSVIRAPNLEIKPIRCHHLTIVYFNFPLVRRCLVFFSGYVWVEFTWLQRFGKKNWKKISTIGLGTPRYVEMKSTSLRLNVRSRPSSLPSVVLWPKLEERTLYKSAKN